MVLSIWSEIEFVILCELCASSEERAGGRKRKKKKNINHPCATLTRDTEYTEKDIVMKDDLTNKIIGCAIEVHKILGPGLLEETYKKCLSYELNNAGLQFEVEYALPVKYKDVNLDCGYRIDILVENQVIVELKSVQKVDDIHKAQLLTYMKLANVSVGLLMNFNEIRLVDGVKRFKL